LLLTSFGGFWLYYKKTRPDQGVGGQALGAGRRGLTPQGAHLQKFFCPAKKILEAWGLTGL